MVLEVARGLGSVGTDRFWFGFDFDGGVGVKA